MPADERGAEGDAPEQSDQVPGDTAPISLKKNVAALTRATSCEDVLARIQADTIARLVARAEELRQPPEVYAGEPGVVLGGDELLPAPATAPTSAGGVALPDGAVGPVLPSNDADVAVDAPVSAPEPAPAGEGFSDTTVQVHEVDEADVIEADGDYIYVLQGSSLVKVQAWPAEQTRTVAAASIEGSPYEMFVSDGKALVFSTVSRDFSSTSSTPLPYGGPYGYYYPTYTKVTVLDVEAETPVVLRESFLEGYYVASRRHDDIVRAVIQASYKVPPLDGVYVEYFTPFGEPYRQQDIDAQVDAWLERITWAVTQTELGDFVPRQFTLAGGEIVENVSDCSDFYQPGRDLSQSGVTQVFSIDLDEDDGTQPLQAATVLANAERVYANDEVVLLAQTNYGDYATGYTETTSLHRFDIDGSDTVYRASGTVPGYVQSQFSLDERDGVVRVSTTENHWDPNTGFNGGPTNRVLTLSAQDGELAVLGQTEVFGQNEQIFATRFIGDQGYVVTFRQTDPLFVVDLSNPAAPSVVGELHIPGFSNFLFPLDADHLLAIGRDATTDGVTLGLALSIFDVSDSSAPALAHQYVYQGDGYSDASVDHRGISFHPDTGRIAFPLYDYLTGASTIQVLDVDAQRGFELRGALAPSTNEYTLEECVIQLGYGETALDDWLRAEIDAWPEYEGILLSQCRSQEQMRRGLFRDEYVFGVSTQAVYAQTVDALGEPAPFRASLPAAYYGGYYPYPGGAIAGGAGAGGAAGAAGSAGVAGAAGAAGASFDGAGGAAFDGSGGAAGAAGFPMDL